MKTSDDKLAEARALIERMKEQMVATLMSGDLKHIKTGIADAVKFLRTDEEDDANG